MIYIKIVYMKIIYKVKYINSFKYNLKYLYNKIALKFHKSIPNQLNFQNSNLVQSQFINFNSIQFLNKPFQFISI